MNSTKPVGLDEITEYLTNDDIELVLIGTQLLNGVDSNVFINLAAKIPDIKFPELKKEVKRLKKRHNYGMSKTVYNPKN